MTNKRKTFKYHFKVRGKTVHTGITDDLERRENEHQQEHGWSTGRIKQQGNRTTREGALKWERGETKKGKPTRKD